MPNIGIETLRGHRYFLSDTIGQVLISLMHQEYVNILRAKVISLKDRQDRARKFARCLQNDASTIHFDGAIEGQVEVFGKHAVTVDVGIQYLCQAFVGVDEAGPGSISKKHCYARFARDSERDRRHLFGPDHQNCSVDWGQMSC